MTMRTFPIFPTAFLLITLPCAVAQNPAPPDPVHPPAANEGYDPLLDPPPLPHRQVSLFGGIVTSLDEVQNHLTITPFGGKQHIHLDFDTRTHIFRDGQASGARDLKMGDRVYVDTMLNGKRVFAKSIWIRSAQGNGNGRGQILRYDSRTSTLTVKDEVSAEPVSFRLDSGTVIRNRDEPGTFSDLRPGALVAITFGAGGRSGIVRELSLLAVPGSAFTFLGTVTFIDLSQNMIAVNNARDKKNYEIYFDSIPTTVVRGLREGTQASISAVFDGSRYVAKKIDIVPTGPSAQ